MHIYFLRSSHDLRFHDILLFFSRLMPVTCNDKIVKAGVDGLLILHGGNANYSFPFTRQFSVNTCGYLRDSWNESWKYPVQAAIRKTIHG